MKRLTNLLLLALGLFAVAADARADWHSLHYGGYQPWWNIFAHRNRYMSCEEERLQRFWHDYYDSLRRYYDSLDNIDWVAYYKNHGYQINAGCGAGGCGGPNQRIQFAPVVVSPTMQWAIPNQAIGGPGCAPGMGGGPGAAPMGYGPGPYGY